MTPRPTTQSTTRPAARSGERAIVLIDHGSRRDEANRQLEELADKVREREADTIVRTAHLEIVEPSLADAIGDCVNQGARDIIVHPYFLGPGRHTSEDIPRLAAEARARHPEVSIRVSAPLGIHDKLVDVVLERVRECSDRQ
jgi:sirohydrochlorin ferrochelatase